MNRSFKIDLQTQFGKIQGELPLADEPIRLAEFALQIISFDERLVDIAVKAAVAGGTEKISCQPNCGACCRQAVPVSIPEAFLLRDLVMSMPEARRLDVLKRIEAIKHGLKSNNIDAELHPGETSDDRWSRLSLRYFALGLACPFLENESCSIYEDRPTVCREFLVISPADACSDPELEYVRGIENVFTLSNCLARVAGILMDDEPNLIPLTHALAWAEENLEWDTKRYDAELLYSALFDILRDVAKEGDLMEKEIQGKWVLYTRHTLTSPMDIGVHASQSEPKLRAIASRHGLEVEGPLEHAYWDMAVQGVPHILEVWLPVKKKAGDQALDELKRVEGYKCLTAVFRRPIEEIGEAWMDLGTVARSLGHRLTNHDREVYRTMDCDRPERNDIELQIGIQ